MNQQSSFDEPVEFIELTSKRPFNVPQPNQAAVKMGLWVNFHISCQCPEGIVKLGYGLATQS